MKKNLKVIPYRSLGLPSGFFSELGATHIHFDGTGDPKYVIEILQPLEREGCLSKLNYVEDFVAGSERLLLPEVYKSHTPEIEGEETIDFFSTTSVDNRQDLVSFLRSERFFKFTWNTKGMTECEQVVAVLKHGVWKWLPKEKRIDSISRVQEVRFALFPTLDFEIHWGFNLPKNAKAISLERLLKFLEVNGVQVGGLFKFQRSDGFGYRSNAFNNEDGLRERLEREHKVFLQFLKQENLDCDIRCVIEKVICVHNWSK